MRRSQQLRGRLAAGFTVSSLPAGDKQSTLLSMFIFSMQHGMVWVGPGDYQFYYRSDGLAKEWFHDSPAEGKVTLDQVRALEKEVASLKGKLASAQGDELVSQAVDVKGLKVLAARLEGADAKTLRDTMDKLKDKLKTAAIVLASVADGKVTLIAGVTSDLTGKVKAGELVNFVAQQVGGKGGGRPDMAQAGGTDVAALPKALESITAFIEERA